MPSQSGFTTQFLPAQMVFEPTSVAAAQHIQSVGYPHIDDSPIDFQNPGRSDTFASVLTYRGAEGRPPMTADSGKTEPPVRSSRLEFFHRPKRDKSAKDGDGKAQPQKKQRGRPPVAMKTNGFSAHNSGANSREESRQSRRSSSRRRSISHFFKGEEPGSEGGEKGRKRDTAIFTPEGKIETTIGGGRPSTAGTGMSRAKSVRKRASEAIMGIGIKGKRGVESRG